MVESVDELDGRRGQSGRNEMDVAKLISRIDVSTFANEEQRAEAVAAAQALVSRLETPWEFIMRTCMGQPALGAALKIGNDLDLFQKWQDEGHLEMTFQELTVMIPSCEPDLLYRILGHLAANHVLQETSIAVFKPTPLSIAFASPVYNEWMNHFYDALIPVFSKLPIYLAQHDYKAPSDPTNGVFQFAKEFKGDLFHYYREHPVKGASFDLVMSSVMAHQASWVDIFPPEILFETDIGGDTPLVVDVGGNIGHDIEKFREKHPDTAARLYLEDLPHVLERAKCNKTVNRVAYDFFTPQPITGARAYYIHSVLHDWSDDFARKILVMQRDALAMGYSTLLIHDHIMADQLAHPQTTAFDLTMMGIVAGKERKAEDFRKLIESAGYNIIKIWTSPQAIQSIIQAERAM
ncbi:S-adenosyl-L-methionine-dependent methyltransferase [Xylaria bambusicola]|uniref:S-adenosyl-L-methionine-dependent methyltransferase n=1 Tax=Xylaria bambusicola TaxID=326684 RepID=UPI0020075291|nr:S-adenosyl-L-methionine-dependent methyltransferase [Xylaria bambusicola]KAI0506275.1 S-adenosyl-L-methionine-dependent methyltransferase [Xylaria bambusicola]